MSNNLSKSIMLSSWSMRSLSKSDNVESVESKVDLLVESMLRSSPIEFKASSREFSFS